MIIEHLETPRLLLRKVTPQVYNHVFSNYTISQLMNFFGFTTSEEMEEERHRYRYGLSTYNKSYLYFHLLSKENNTVLGWCGYHTWYVPHSRAELGYLLRDEAFFNQGLMTEALEPIIRYGFAEMNLNRIEAFTSPVNMASQRLLQKHHFSQEGHLREHYRKNDVLEDSLLFGLLRSEYQGTL